MHWDWCNLLLPTSIVHRSLVTGKSYGLKGWVGVTLRPPILSIYTTLLLRLRWRLYHIIALHQRRAKIGLCLDGRKNLHLAQRLNFLSWLTRKDRYPGGYAWENGCRRQKSFTPGIQLVRKMQRLRNPNNLNLSPVQLTHLILLRVDSLPFTQWLCLR